MSCNTATGAEAAKVLSAIESPYLMLNWDRGMQTLPVKRHSLTGMSSCQKSESAIVTAKMSCERQINNTTGLPLVPESLTGLDSCRPSSAMASTMA